MSESISPYWDAYREALLQKLVRDPRPPLSYDTGAAGRNRQRSHFGNTSPNIISRNLRIGIKNLDNLKRPMLTEEDRSRNYERNELAREAKSAFRNEIVMQDIGTPLDLIRQALIETQAKLRAGKKAAKTG